MKKTGDSRCGVVHVLWYFVHFKMQTVNITVTLSKTTIWQDRSKYFLFEIFLALIAQCPLVQLLRLNWVVPMDYCSDGQLGLWGI